MMTLMQTKKGFLIIASIVILNSCAGLGIRSGAKHEFDQGFALFNRGQYEEAIPHFEKATKIEPDFAQAYLYLGRSYLNLGRWHEAIVSLRTALRLSPEDSKKEVIHILVDALFGAAFSDLKKGNFQTCVRSLRQILELQPESDKASNELFRALLALGREFLSEKKAGEAIAAFSEAVKLSPADLKAYLGLARAFFQNEHFLEAIQTIRKAIKIDPTNREAQNFLRELLGQ